MAKGSDRPVKAAVSALRCGRVSSGTPASTFTSNDALPTMAWRMLPPWPSARRTKSSPASRMLSSATLTPVRRGLGE